MKRIVTAFLLGLMLVTGTPVFAAEGAATDGGAGAAAPAVAAERKPTVFDNVASFLAGFDRRYTRRGNTQGFWNATADWMRNINKY